MGYATMDDLIGEEFFSVRERNEEALVFEGVSKKFSLHHQQDCCEDVHLSEVFGDLSDLEGSPILLAEESFSEIEDASESGTWSFYKFATVKGHVTITFRGESNGYYSETAGLYTI